MKQIEVERDPIRDKEAYFINNTEKDLHFRGAKYNIDDFKETLEERFKLHYRGEVEYNKLREEIIEMLNNGKHVTGVEKSTMEKYKSILNETDLFDLLSDIVISRQVEHEKERYHYKDEKKDAAM